LTLHPRKVYLQEATKGVIFLGAAVKPYRRYVIFETKLLQALAFQIFRYFVQGNQIGGIVYSTGKDTFQQRYAFYNIRTPDLT